LFERQEPQLEREDLPFEQQALQLKRLELSFILEVLQEILKVPPFKRLLLVPNLKAPS
jgi:hypothetical protein